MSYRYLTPNLTGGIASKDVLARVDLEKYQTFLKQCKNGVIKPYGGVYKRPGTLLVDTVSENVRLFVFKQPEVDYLLEFSHQKIRARLKGAVVSTITSPFLSSDLPNLKIVQSANTMFICSGRLPVMELKRNGNTFSIKKLKIPIPPFDEMKTGVNFTAEQNTGETVLNTNVNFFEQSMQGEAIKVLERVETVIENVAHSGVQTLGPQRMGSNPILKLSGTWTGSVEHWIKASGWTKKNTYTTNGTYNVYGNNGTQHKLVISVQSGTVNVRLESDDYESTSGDGGS